ncbi:cell adhesion molecule 3-like isoform X2 [Patiria miniata]|uniref:Ig-like domain-containing protein n=1 Tax=Patiria miniata TaxID=46514 RepID=A0A914AF68_PATMI|nr:cell adhesion molecule 3-like isoform X2 [Patiria miniata]
MDRLWTSVTLGVFLACLPYTIVDAVGPSDTAALRGGAATLTCSNPAYTSPSSGAAFWEEGGTPFGTQQNGIYTAPEFAKYTNFDIVSTEYPQMDLTVSNAQVEDEGTYTCTLQSDQGSATLTVEIEGNEPTITLNSDPSVTPIRLIAGVESVLRCTASGFRPAVNLEWYKDDVKITAGITEDPATSNGDTFTTVGTLTFTPTIPDDGDRLECRTTGQVVATAKTGALTLSVQFVPVVTVGYSGGQITCSSEANPLATTHQIIRNGTDVLKEFTNSPGSVEFTPKYCAVISCNATNTIGTGTDTFADQICPGYVEPTTPAPPKPSEPTPKPTVGLDAGIIAAIAIGCLIVVALVIGGIVYCYTQKKFCFDSNKTSNGGSSPKKQPSVVNADMIRNQPEVRQSVHNYDDEPKKPRVPRSNSGKPAPEKEALKQSAPPTDNDHQGYPMDSYDGDPQEGRGQAGVNYADLQFQNRDRPTNGHGKIHQSDEEPTQYASILV